VTALAGLTAGAGRGRRGAGIAERLDALDRVLALARGRVDGDVVARAEQVAAKAGDRLRFGEAHTVVALAGSTGSGKSSLFNALAGESLSLTGMRRPTTGVAHAAVWGGPDAGQDAGPLLDWLDVPRRHLLPRPEPELDGLVLLDLPDVDSVEHSHRLAADRLIERVDLLVWVLDPQKYADSAVHDRYLAPLAGHADVMLVVLNQVDRLPPQARQGCLIDLRGLLQREGLGAVPVVPASARTGDGLDGLRDELMRRVAAKRASVRRLEADLSALASALDGVCVQDGPGRSGGTGGDAVARRERDDLVTALADAAGAEVIADAVARTHRLRAGRATGWPFTRWTSRLRRDPARRLRLRDNPSELVRTSLPRASAVQRARVDSALREVGRRASEGLPEPWPASVRRAATGARDGLPDLLDRAVAGADLGLRRRPLWWRAVNVLQWLLAAVTLAGALWLAALFVVAWLQLPDPPLPHWGPLPVPTVLLAGGAALGLLVALVSRLFARIGAARAAARARRRVTERVERLAQDTVIDPVQRELAAHTELCRALARLRG
jgi:energy-coupling factor transporter ATP-binding protein EcfA2